MCDNRDKRRCGLGDCLLREAFWASDVLIGLRLEDWFHQKPCDNVAMQGDITPAGQTRMSFIQEMPCCLVLLARAPRDSIADNYHISGVSQKSRQNFRLERFAWGKIATRHSFAAAFVCSNVVILVSPCFGMCSLCAEICRNAPIDLRQETLPLLLSAMLHSPNFKGISTALDACPGSLGTRNIASSLSICLSLLGFPRRRFGLRGCAVSHTCTG
jgi:hypothetical protein